MSTLLCKKCSKYLKCMANILSVDIFHDDTASTTINVTKWSRSNRCKQAFHRFNRPVVGYFATLQYKCMNTRASYLSDQIIRLICGETLKNLFMCQISPKQNFLVLNFSCIFQRLDKLVKRI